MRIYVDTKLLLFVQMWQSQCAKVPRSPCLKWFVCFPIEGMWTVEAATRFLWGFLQFQPVPGTTRQLALQILVKTHWGNYFEAENLFGIPSNWPFEEWVETHTFRLSLDPWPCSHCWGQMASRLTTYKKYFILNQYLLYTEKSLSGKDIFSSISWIFPQPRVPFN